MQSELRPSRLCPPPILRYRRGMAGDRTDKALSRIDAALQRLDAAAARLGQENAALLVETEELRGAVIQAVRRIDTLLAADGNQP